MSFVVDQPMVARAPHAWLRTIRVAFVPNEMTPLLKELVAGLRERFRRHGHDTPSIPDNHTDVIMTTAPFGEPLHWREALLFTARRRFKLDRSPTLYTLVHAPIDRFHALMEHFRHALAKEPIEPADFEFPGLAPQAYRVLVEQGRRGGPILALERLVQAYAKALRIILIVGDERPLDAYHFDLVGAYPRTNGANLEAFYDDIVFRVVTSVSTREVNHHETIGEPIAREIWNDLTTPAAMIHAGKQLGERHFFTDMVRIADIVQVPAVADAVASQYSEGCFATWEPRLQGLITTITGSARPVNKGNLTEEDLAIIVGIRSDHMGALVRQVAGKAATLPSSEAVEMMAVDMALPRIQLGPSWSITGQVPVIRSKLHGHRGVAAYDPERVEYVPLDPPYYYYPVSCATDAQAEGIQRAFARSRALQHPADPRQVVFTVLPGHGAVIVEKWVAGKEPFQTIWEYMDAGYIEIENHIPQGPMTYTLRGSRMVLQT